ncbi:hypothetical protein [Aureibaculum luteum]|uniref:hypothetical protein n=1 Tax=Aureibaculum luteum TaxID=1548456 RepID=UPI000E5357EA|nr:hypothetical protein [Aureibaculum luteum]
MKNLKKSTHQAKGNYYFFNRILLLTIAFFTTILVFTACSKDDILNPNGNCGNSSWAQQVEKEITAWNNAATAYSQDPTTTNCNNYKSAGKNYLDALEGIKNCVPGASTNDFKKAIEDAKNELDAMNCQ